MSVNWAEIITNKIARFGSILRAVDSATYDPGHDANDAVAETADKVTGGTRSHIVGVKSTVSFNIDALSYLTDSITAVENLATSLTTATDLICATAGTAVQGATATVTKEVTIFARTTNTGTIYIGGSNVTNGSGSRRGCILDPGGMVKLKVSNLNLIYINADNNGDGAGILVT